MVTPENDAGTPPSAPRRWDEIWRRGASGVREVHVWISLNAQAGAHGKPIPALEEKTAAKPLQ